MPCDQMPRWRDTVFLSRNLVEVDVSIEEGAVIKRLSVEDVDVFRRIRLEALSHEPFSLRAYLTIGSISPTVNGASILTSQFLSRS